MKPGDKIQWKTVNGLASGVILRSAGWIVDLGNSKVAVVDEASAQILTEQTEGNSDGR